MDLPDFHPMPTQLFQCQRNADYRISGIGMAVKKFIVTLHCLLEILLIRIQDTQCRYHGVTESQRTISLIINSGHRKERTPKYFNAQISSHARNTRVKSDYRNALVKTCLKLLEDSRNRVKHAIFMEITGLTLEQAEKHIVQAKGRLRIALNNYKKLGV